MSKTHEIKVTKRELQRKGASRRLRHAGVIPAIVYGGNAEPVAISLDHNATWLAQQNEWFYSSILSLNLDGQITKVLLRDMQRHPHKQLIMHLDFLRVDENQALTASVPLHFLNEDTSPAGKAADVVVTHELKEVTVSCLPKDLPESIDVDLGELKAGDVVLDLGSGGGIDVLLSARRVGPTGKAYGLDMTDEMLALARENQAASGLTNVEFLKGEIERMPLPDNSVDVIISNCVINLSADKDQVIAEAFRVLKPGGRFAVSDVVVRGGDVPAEVRRSMELWVGCVAGALEESRYRDALSRAGFEDVDVEPTRVYRAADAKQFLEGAGISDEAVLAQIDGRFMSAFIRSSKGVLWTHLLLVNDDAERRTRGQPVAASFFCLLPSAFYLLSSIFYLLSPISVSCLLSPVSCLLSPSSFLLSPIPYLLSEQPP